MNILVIHNYYKIRGGEDAVFENESNMLEKAGHKVIKYSRHNNEIDNYNFFQKLFFFFESLYSFKTVSDLKEITNKEKINIAHIHNTFPLISPSAYRFLKKKGVKIVQTIHNYRFLCLNALFYRKEKVCTLCTNGNYFNGVKYRCYKNSLINSLLYFFILKFNRKVFRKNIDGYIVLTGFTKKIFSDATFNEKKIFIKDNGLPDNTKRIVNDKRYFLYFGRISQEKGITFLLESFIKLPDYRLILAGTGEKLEELIEKYRESTNISFTGFLSGEQKDRLMSEAVCLIIPSVWYENYPVTIIESFRIGLPVIGSRIGGIPFIVTDYKNGLLFEVNNFDDFKEKLNLLWNDSKLRDTLGVNARNEFLQRMEFTNNIKRMEAIYRKILNEKNQG